MRRRDIAFIQKEIKKCKKSYKTELRKIKNHQFDKNGPQYNNTSNQKNKSSFTWFNQNKQIHRDNKPAIIYEDGTHCWYKNGICYNEHKPAIVGKLVCYNWTIPGKYHSETKPTSISIGKSEYWKHEYKSHRINGFANINLMPQKFEIESDARNINCHNEIYLLFVDGVQYFNEEAYVKACEEWMLKNKTTHEYFDTLEELEKNLKQGRFNKNNWYKNKFKPERKKS